MPRNASGIYTLPGGNPVTPGDVIEAAWANTTLEDVADAITNSLSRTGAGGMLAPFRIADGSVSAPGLSYLNETNTGLYRSGSGSTWMSVLGVNVAQFSTVGVTIPFGKALTALGNATVSGTFGVTGATTLSSTLAVTGALTATGGVVGNVTGNVTAASGTSSFNDVTISGSLDMIAGSSATITGLSTPTNASDAANKGYVDTQDALKLSLTGGTMSGNIAMGGNLVTGLGTPVSGGDATNKTYVDAQVATRLALSGGTMAGQINMNGNALGNLPTPTGDSEAATKGYVDTVAQGLDAKASCKAASVGNLTLSGGQIIDGIGCSTGDRVLVKNQTTASQNGIYVVAGGLWTRATDADTWNELVAAFTFVEQGTVNANSGWVCTVAPGGTLGTTAVTWAQFSGAGQIDAGPGLVKSGNTLSVGTASSSRIVVNTDDIDLATTAITPGTYKSLTIDAYGRATAGTNPTTLSGFGITDAYTQTQVDTLVNAKLSLSGGTMSGAIAMGGSKITGLGTPTNTTDAATKTYVDTADALKLNLTGGIMSGVIAMGANKITGLADPTLAQDAATKNYIDTIFGSTTSAAASATAAASSASAAATSATNAATSATNAATSATNASTTYTNFNNQYLGSKTSDPTVNNTGGALVAGNLYWNSTASEMRVYNGSAWVAAYLPAAGYLALTGGTMTGTITFAAGQTIAGYAALTGASFTGNISTTGTASATNFIPTGSTASGNGMYLPAANNLGWSISGTEAMRLNSTGFVVGSSTAKARFQVSAASAQNSPTLGTAQGIVYLSNNDPAYGLCIGNSSATGVAWFQAQRTDGTALAYDIALNPAGGNVGIGTSSPAAKLDTAGTIRSTSQTVPASGTGAELFYDATNAGLRGYNRTGSAYVTLALNDNIYVDGGSSGNVKINGNLGLGVTPSAWVTLKGIQVNSGANFAGWNNRAYMTANAFYGGANWVYQATDFATAYMLQTGQHQWYTAPSGTAGTNISFTQAMTLDASGNLGVGTTSPSYKLDVNGQARISTGLTLTAATSSLYATDGTLSRYSTTNATYLNGNDAGWLGLQASGLQKTLINLYGSTEANNPNIINFYTNSVERARIDSSGNLLVGTTSASLTSGIGIKLTPAGDGANWPRLNVITGSASNSENNPIAVYSTGVAAFRFYVGAGGTISATNTTITAISDQRLKENIRDLDDGLDVVMALKPRRFDWKEGKGANIKNARGFIAQEFETVLPDMIEQWLDPAPEGEEPYKAINANLIPTLVKAIQEQQAIIETLQADVAALKGTP